MARVYSYIRFSDARQAAGASSERQAEYARRWAEEHGLELDTTLSMRDEGLSAFHQRHVRQGALGVFLKAIDDGRVTPGSVLVVEGLDRLSRAEPLQAQAQLGSIINAGVSVVTASDGKVYSRERLKANPMDLVYSLLVMIRAHEESDTKSKRVRDALRRQCQGWLDGTYRGLIRYGKTPGWLRVAEGRWEVMPERAAAIAMVVDLFRRGLGTGAIAKALHAAGLAPSAAVPTSTHIGRLLAQPALVGDKVINVDGTEYVLRDYYPAVLSRQEQDELAALVQVRGRRKTKGEIPSILTGFGVAACGYCGSPMRALNMTSRRDAQGRIPDSMRRIGCIKANHGDGCAVPGSASIVPLERAIMAWCADLVNLRSLYLDDAGALPRAELAAAQARLAEVDRKLQRLTAAMLESDDPPAAFTRLARELEAQRDELLERERKAERGVAEAARADTAGVERQWAALAEGVHALEPEARMRSRQLVADTFERIVVFIKGMRPGETPRGSVDMVLMAKGGGTRALRIDAQGGWLDGEDMAGGDA